MAELMVVSRLDDRARINVELGAGSNRRRKLNLVTTLRWGGRKNFGMVEFIKFQRAARHCNHGRARSLTYWTLDT